MLDIILMATHPYLGSIGLDSIGVLCGAVLLVVVPIWLHRNRKQGATKPVLSFRILSLGIFNPPLPPHSPFLGTPKGTAVA